MEPQNQLKVETLFPDFCFKVFSFSYVDGVGGGVTLPLSMSLLWTVVSEWLQVVFVSWIGIYFHFR